MRICLSGQERLFISAGEFYLELILLNSTWLTISLLHEKNKEDARLICLSFHAFVCLGAGRCFYWSAYQSIPSRLACSSLAYD